MTSPDRPARRPRSLEVAALLVLVQAAVLAVWGVVELVRALTGHPSDRGTAVLLGVVVLIYAAAVAMAARGLWQAKRWAQTPTYLVSFFAVVIGLGQLETLPLITVPLIIIGLTTFVAVSLPASRDALGGI
jgi:hypothetical protein